MKLAELEKGDTIYANCHIYNDGSIPEVEENAMLASPGTRGILVEKGHLEEEPQREIYLVRFEDEQLNLGPAVGCWPEELSVEQNFN